MLGHRNGLDGVYLQITNEKLFEEFRAGIVDLTINPTERQNLKITELEKKNNKIKELERVQKITTARIEQMIEVFTTKQNKRLDEGKQPTTEHLQEFARFVRLKMDVDPEFKEDWIKMAMKDPALSAEIKKKYAAI